MFSTPANTKVARIGGLAKLLALSSPLTVPPAAIAARNQYRKETDPNVPLKDKFFSRTRRSAGQGVQGVKNWINQNRGGIGSSVGALAGLSYALATRNPSALKYLAALPAGAGLGWAAGRALGKDKIPESNGKQYNVNLIDPGKHYVARPNVYGFNSYSPILRTIDDIKAEQARNTRKYKTGSEKVALSRPPIKSRDISRMLQFGVKQPLLFNPPAKSLSKYELAHIRRANSGMPGIPYRAPKASLTAANPTVVNPVVGESLFDQTARRVGNFALRHKVPVALGTTGILTAPGLLKKDDYKPAEKLTTPYGPHDHPADRFIMGDIGSWDYDQRRHGFIANRFTPEAGQRMMDAQNNRIAHTIMAHNKRNAYDAWRNAYIDWFRNGKQGAEPRLESWENMLSQSKTAGLSPIGSKGWIWDTSMGSEGNLRGWGTMAGGTLGTLLGLRFGKGGRLGKYLATAGGSLAGYKGLGFGGESAGRITDRITGHTPTRREVDRRMTFMPTTGELLMSGVGGMTGLNGWGLPGMVNSSSPLLAATAPHMLFGSHNEEPMMRMFGKEKSRLPGYEENMKLSFMKSGSCVKKGVFFGASGLLGGVKTATPAGKLSLTKLGSCVKKGVPYALSSIGLLSSGSMFEMEKDANIVGDGFRGLYDIGTGIRRGASNVWNMASPWTRPEESEQLWGQRIADHQYELNQLDEKWAPFLSNPESKKQYEREKAFWTNELKRDQAYHKGYAASADWWAGRNVDRLSAMNAQRNKGYTPTSQQFSNPQQNRTSSAATPYTPPSHSSTSYPARGNRQYNYFR